MEITLLTELLQNHDWYYERSDDHRHYSAGLNNINKIVEIGKQLPKEMFIEVYNSFTPDNFKIQTTIEI